MKCGTSTVIAVRFTSWCTGEDTGWGVECGAGDLKGMGTGGQSPVCMCAPLGSHGADPLPSGQLMTPFWGGVAASPLGAAKVAGHMFECTPRHWKKPSFTSLVALEKCRVLTEIGWAPGQACRDRL